MPEVTQLGSGELRPPRLRPGAWLAGRPRPISFFTTGPDPRAPRRTLVLVPHIGAQGPKPWPGVVLPGRASSKPENVDLLSALEKV